MKQLRILYTTHSWRIAIGLAVFANSLVLGAITDAAEGSTLADWLEHADAALLTLLVLDAALCILTKRRAVLHSGWDLFDISVTLISITPTFRIFSAFRVLRVVRVLRLISFIPQGRAMIDAFLAALRNMGAAFVLLAVVFYSFVIITTNLFREMDPAHFGSLSRSSVHLYTVMVSLGSNLDTESVLDSMPWALPIYGVFIVVASFGLMNMFIAVLVSALKEQLEKESVKEERVRLDRLERKIDAMAAAVDALRRASVGQ